MKAWEPEEIFEKADFPAKKPGGRSGGKTGANRPGQARPGEASPGNRAGAKQEAGVPRPPAGGRPPQQPGVPGAAWEPDLDFERADFSGVSPEEAASRGDSRSSSDAMANVAAGRPGPVSNPAGSGASIGARAWQPPKLSEQARRPEGRAAGGPTGDGSVQTPKVVGSRIRQGPGSPGHPSETPVMKQPGGNQARVVNPGGAADPGSASGASGFSQRLLEELTILHRENARHILRHWYWEKAGMAPEGLGHIAPHHRIYMILSGLGSQVLMVLYESMSPTERRQMQEILNRPPNATAQETLRVRTTFMQLLRADI